LLQTVGGKGDDVSAEDSSLARGNARSSLLRWQTGQVISVRREKKLPHHNSDPLELEKVHE
jgi:hypothetical protein